MAASHDWHNWRDRHSGHVEAEDAFMAGHAAGEACALGLWTDCKDGDVITVCKAAPTGDQVVQPVVLRVTDDIEATTDAVKTEPGWEQRLDALYDLQASLVMQALRALPMATRHRLLAKQLLEHPMLLRLPGSDYGQRDAVGCRPKKKVTVLDRQARAVAEWLTSRQGAGDVTGEGGETYADSAGDKALARAAADVEGITEALLDATPPLGQEAEELRGGIERLLEDIDADADPEDIVADLQRLLDDVDARDSLVYLERRR